MKIDLITGFLGAGKTTFLKRYARYHIGRGERVCILENDYGAVNVDMMLMQELIAEGCDAEMVAGGCDAGCHRRRFKTKLIAMGMSGYDRVIVEPSGIYDTDEFFDALREEPLDRWYEIGSVIAIVDPNNIPDAGSDAEYILASETAGAGVIILSHIGHGSEPKIKSAKDGINAALKGIGADRQIHSDEIISIPWDELTDDDFKRVTLAGYRLTDYRKRQIMDDNAYETLYFMQDEYISDGLSENVRKILADERCGRVLRIKGFFDENGRWMELNATPDNVSLAPLDKGQRIVIVIGEDLDRDRISAVLNGN